jgi:hypothetical protein
MTRFPTRFPSARSPVDLLPGLTTDHSKEGARALIAQRTAGAVRRRETRETLYEGPLYPTENGALSVCRLRPFLLGEAYMRELFFSVILTSQTVGPSTLKSFSRCY